MNYAAYLFDFDYTMANAEKGIFMSYRSVLQKHGYPDVTDGAIRRTVGLPVPEGFTMLCGETDQSRLKMYWDEFTAAADTCMTANTVFYPGALSLVRKLKDRGKLTGIISTKSAYRIAAALEKYSITGLFDVVVGGEMVERFKPDPEGVLLALERLGVGRDAALYIGDTVTDAETARRAGVDFAGVTTGATSSSELAAWPNIAIVPDLGELEGYLQGPERLTSSRDFTTIY